MFETTTIIAEGLEPATGRPLLETTPQFPIFDDSEEEENEGVLYKFEPEKPLFTVHNRGNGLWELSGEGLERTFRMSKLNNEEDFMRFARKMRTLGIDEALRNAGCVDGDTVVSVAMRFTLWSDSREDLRAIRYGTRRMAFPVRGHPFHKGPCFPWETGPVQCRHGRFRQRPGILPGSGRLPDRLQLRCRRNECAMVHTYSR
ncbi:MAG: Obg family GTPase CgtA [Merdibacter sp.]